MMPKYLIYHETGTSATITCDSFRVEKGGILYFFNFSSVSPVTGSIPELGVAAFKDKEWESVTILQKAEEGMIDEDH